MLYCFAPPESVERILERHFVRADRAESVQISKHAGDVYMYRRGAPEDTEGGEVRICANSRWCTLRDGVLTPPALVRSVELRLCDYASPVAATAPLYEDPEFTATLAPAMGLTVGRASSNGRRLGTFLIPSNRRTRLALLDLLKKHETIEAKPDSTTEDGLVALLTQLKKF